MITPSEVGYLEDADWFKSSFSGDQGSCLEAAFLPDGRVALRDNEDLANPPFVVSRYVWQCWLDGARACFISRVGAIR